MSNTDPVLAAVQRFIDAVRSQLTKQADETRSALAEIQTRAATSGPQGERGEPGPPGKDGRDGVDGKDGRDGKDGERGLAGEKGERGADGLNGRDGAASVIPGPPGERGERGADGLNGRDGAASIIPGPPGPQGERGADGIATLEELDARIEARFAELQVRTLADSYREVYRSGEQYRRGEVVTWGGSLFLAMADTTDKPETTPSWRLVVKHGRDGARK